VSPPEPAGIARVLVADDNELNRDLLSRRVRRLGHEVVLAEDGRQTLELLRAEPFDVVLLDIMMPNLNGYEVLEAVRVDDHLMHIPIIMISAVDDPESIARCIRLGAVDYLPKPFDPTILQARLGASLARKRLHDREQIYARSLQRELEIGREIQSHFLPESLPTPPGYELAARLRSARMVSGDFYDAFTLSGGETVVVVGDVCDKGVGAALFMALFRSLLRALAEQSEGARWNDRGRGRERRRDATSRDDAIRGNLLRTVTLANDYIAGTHSRSNMFATVFFGILDTATGLLYYVNAGHEPPAILTSSGLTRLQPTGPALGLLPQLEFRVGEAALRPGEALFIWTDGVTEAQDAAGALFGEDRLAELLVQGPGSADDLIERVLGEVQRFAAGAEQADDITLAAVRRLPG
jgi:serine phosphatase RsbU (regulator of sigma subunit)